MKMSKNWKNYKSFTKFGDLKQNSYDFKQKVRYF